MQHGASKRPLTSGSLKKLNFLRVIYFLIKLVYINKTGMFIVNKWLVYFISAKVGYLNFDQTPGNWVKLKARTRSASFQGTLPDLIYRESLSTRLLIVIRTKYD